LPRGWAIAENNWRALSSNGARLRREASSICVSSPGGSRSTLSANRQNTSRLTMRHLLRIVAAVAKVAGKHGEAPGGVRRYGGTGLLRAQLVRV